MLPYIGIYGSLIEFDKSLDFSQCNIYNCPGHIVLCVMYVGVSEGLQMEVSSGSYNLVQSIFSFVVNAPVRGPHSINQSQVEVQFSRQCYFVI